MEKIAVDRSGTVEGLARLLNAYNQVEGLLILACADNGFVPEDVNPLLQALKIPVFGGIFPSIIYGAESLGRGTIVAGFSERPRVQILSNMSQEKDRGYSFDVDLVNDDTKTLFVLVDGLVMDVTDLLDAIFDSFGSELKYLGGGAGSVATMEPSPCLFTNSGLLQNGAVLVALDTPSRVGASHGLRSVSGPHVITKAEGNIVYSLDQNPIYPFFQEQIARLLMPGEDDRFPLISRHFSLGLSRLGEEKVIREPAKIIDRQALAFGTKMVEGELLDIMRASHDDVLAALLETIESINIDLKPNDGLFILFDCICRKWFFADRYDEILGILHKMGLPMIGAQTIGGEISCNGDGYLEYLNRTCVIGCLER